MANTLNAELPQVDSAFLNVLQHHRGGAVLTDLADAMREVTEAVQLSGKAGGVTLRILVQPAGARGAIIIADDIKTTLPKLDKVTSIFFADDNGNLVRNDPNQRELPLRSIDGGAEVLHQPLQKVN
jgi:hypothetical protein